MSKFKIFGYMRVIYIKRKLRTCTIQIQKEKVWLFEKKNFFFEIFDFFSKGGTLWCRNRQKKIFQFFKNFENEPQKWLLWDYSNINRNKVMIFGGRSSYSAETVRLFTVIRAIMPPPLPKIGLKNIASLLSRNYIKKYLRSFKEVLLVSVGQRAVKLQDVKIVRGPSS